MLKKLRLACAFAEAEHYHESQRRNSGAPRSNMHERQSWSKRPGAGGIVNDFAALLHQIGDKRSGCWP